MSTRNWFLLTRTITLACLVGGMAGSLVAVAWGQAPGSASTFRPDDSVTADLLLRNAEAHIRAEHWGEAITIYQRVLADHGGAMVKLPREDSASGTDLFVDVRRDIQRRLAAMPPEALALYRRRVDPQAEGWYQAGAERGDRAALRRVVDEAFSSSWGDEALDLLGDLAFREGRFAEALTLYRQIVPETDGVATALRYPDPDVDLARVTAKALLCRAALGNDPPGREELLAYAQRYPNAEGVLAGRTGPYLRSLVEAIRDDGLAAGDPPDGRWATFAGSPNRTKIIPTPIDVGSIQQQIPLASVDVSRETNSLYMSNFAPSRPPRPDLALVYHPIVLGDQVVVCEAGRMVAYNLTDSPADDGAGTSGPPPVAWDQPLPTASLPSPRLTTAAPPSRFTLTAHGDRIFARLGPTQVRSRVGDSYILAVRNSREPLVEGKLLWMRRASEIELPEPRGGTSRQAVFEGSPVADDRGVYVAITDAGTLMNSYVACLDSETGAALWVRYLGEASVALDPTSSSANVNDLGDRLLTLDGQRIYYQTNLGAVAALDAQTGEICWLATYATRGNHAAGIGRDLNSAVVDGDRVIVAPADTPEILAFDATTGRLAWKSRPLPEITHLLGVARGRVIATGNRVWSLDAETGEVLVYWPEAGAGYQGYGRGLLAGDSIYWPTKTEIHVLDQATGLRSEAGSIPLQEAFGTSGGNLAVGDGFLIVAQADRLVVFSQNSRLIRRYQEAIAAAPAEASNYVRLARVAEATGETDLALESLDRALELAGASEQLDDRPLREEAQAQRYRLLMRLGGVAADAGHWAEAAQRFEAAADGGTSDRDVLMAQLRLAESLQREGNPRQAVELLQGLLVGDRYRLIGIPAEPERTVRADRMIADRLTTLILAHGSGIYESYDRQARELLDRGRTTGDPELLEEISQSYPGAEVVAESLLALGALRETSGQFREAAHAYRRLLAGDARAEARAEALLGLGRAYEAQGLLVPAHEALRQARSRHGDVQLNSEQESVRQHVDRMLAREPFAELEAGGAEPRLALPLRRSWSTPWPARARPLLASGTPPAAGTGGIFLATSSTLGPLDTATGQAAWTADLGGEPLWAGYLADRVVIATARRLVAVDLHDGSPLWSFDAQDPEAGRRHTNPFARPAADTPKESPGDLHDLRIVNGTVFGLRGEQELLAINGETGLVDWSFTPTAGILNRHYQADSERVLIQVRDPNAIVVLDAATGRRRVDYPQHESERPWARDPLPLDDDHVGLVIEPRTVTLFDLSRGVDAWSYREPGVLPRSGPPRLISDSGTLLVLRDGSELVRLDPTTGARLWSRVLGIEDLSEWPDALAVDGQHVYCACGPTPSLIAYALSDGAPVWRRHLVGPESGWSVALAEGIVAAYPSPERSAAGELPALPLVFCRRDDGRLVQRLLFAAPVSQLAVQLARGSSLIATQGRGWALGPLGAVDEAGPPE